MRSDGAPVAVLIVNYEVYDELTVCLEIVRSREAVRSYFDREAERFDAIYEERKPLHQRLVDRARGVVVASHVVGIDLAPAMIEIARRHAADVAVADRADCRVSSFLDFQSSDTFDVVVAAGYFDYLEDPVPHLRKMLELSRGHIHVTVPKRWEYRVPIRALRVALARGYVRFYSRREFLAVAQAAGVSLDHVSPIDLGRDWVAVIRAGR